MHSATPNMDALCHTSDAVSCASHGCLSTSRSLRSVCSQGWTIEGTNEGKSVNRLAKIWQAHRMQRRTAPSFPTAALRRQKVPEIASNAARIKTSALSSPLIHRARKPISTNLFIDASLNVMGKLPLQFQRVCQSNLLAANKGTSGNICCDHHAGVAQVGHSNTVSAETPPRQPMAAGAALNTREH